ncbi:hypothetical protein ACF08M_33250 [Streptomyces sp. NPDC015032]|uniref:hypothetical protein n=1 Tax=Streptomyces sp. NPDC015032 TaxID=3364937 RepID=UPI0036F5401B
MTAGTTSSTTTARPRGFVHDSREQLFTVAGGTGAAAIPMFTALSNNTDHGSGTRQRCRHDGPPGPVASDFALALWKRQTADLTYAPELLLKAVNIRRGPTLRSASRTAVKTLLTVVYEANRAVNGHQISRFAPNCDPETPYGPLKF